MEPKRDRERGRGPGPGGGAETKGRVPATGGPVILRCGPQGDVPQCPCCAATREPTSVVHTTLWECSGLHDALLVSRKPGAVLKEKNSHPYDAPFRF